MDKVGKEGVITVEEGPVWKTNWTSSKVCSSIAAISRPISSISKETMSVELENPYILLHDKKISNIRDLLPLLEKWPRPVARC